MHHRFLEDEHPIWKTSPYVKAHKKQDRPGQFSAEELQELLHRACHSEIELEEKRKKKEEAARSKKEAARSKKEEGKRKKGKTNKRRKTSQDNNVNGEEEPRESKGVPIWGRRMCLWDLEY